MNQKVLTWNKLIRFRRSENWTFLEDNGSLNGYKGIQYQLNKICFDLVDCYSKFKNAISHKVHELKSSAANDISIISIPIKIFQANAVIKERKNTV